MKKRTALWRWALLAAGIAAAAGLACGKGGHASTGHGEAAHAPSQPPPTPDTTPIAALRTPAGRLLLQTPAPAPQTTPAAAPAANRTR
jgi:hypothetical protein